MLLRVRMVAYPGNFHAGLTPDPSKWVNSLIISLFSHWNLPGYYDLSTLDLNLAAEV